jgi:hypothetical protein
MKGRSFLYQLRLQEQSLRGGARRNPVKEDYRLQDEYQGMRGCSVRKIDSGQGIKQGNILRSFQNDRRNLSALAQWTAVDAFHSDAWTGSRFSPTIFWGAGRFHKKTCAYQASRHFPHRFLRIESLSSGGSAIKSALQSTSNELRYP